MIREKRFLQSYLQQQQYQTDEEELANANENHPHRKQEQNFCSIFIYTDPFLWKQVLQTEGKLIFQTWTELEIKYPPYYCYRTALSGYETSTWGM